MFTRKFRQLLIVCLCICLMASISSRALLLAQDVPPPAATESVTATASPAPTSEATNEPSITVSQQPGGTLIVGWNAFSNFFGIIVAIMAGGFSFSLGTIIIVIRQVRQNENIKDALQKLYMSQPVELRQREQQVLQLGQEVIGLGTDVAAVDAVNANVVQAAKTGLP